MGVAGGGSGEVAGVADVAVTLEAERSRASARWVDDYDRLAVGAGDGWGLEFDPTTSSVVGEDFAFKGAFGEHWLNPSNSADFDRGFGQACSGSLSGFNFLVGWERLEIITDVEGRIVISNQTLR